MVKYLVIFSKQAEKDKALLKAAGIDGKARELIRVMAENPFAAPPRYEKLIGDLSGLYSRRINIQHRLVYEVIDTPIEKNGVKYKGMVRILRMWTHYEK